MNRFQKPFTLIEVMVVTLIIGLLVTVVTFNFDNLLPGSRLDGATRKLGGMINMLYEKSIASGRLYGLKYNTTDNYYEIRLLFLEDKESQNSLDTNVGEYSGRFYLPEGVVFKEINDDFGQSVPRDNENMEVRFDPAGYVSPHRVHLQLKDSDNEDDEWTLEVTFLTGQVIYHRGYYEPVVTLERIAK